MATIKCRKCSSFGHIARNCPVPDGINMSMQNANNIQQLNPFQYPQATLNPFAYNNNNQPNYFQNQTSSQNMPNTQQQQPPLNQDYLNYLRGNHDSSNRGYSQH
jgi:hypothetical protein